ncbi:MAG: hypothetical protein ACKVP4_10860 [Hyphomicrobium sp.]
MKIRSAMAGLATVVAAIATAAVPSAHSADAASPDWPCVWRKTLTLDAATIWDGPPVDKMDGWQNDETVRKLSQFLISRRIKIEDAEAAVKKYAESQAADVRDQKLTMLFASVLSRTNEERKIILSGIERFHKRQLERSKEIEKQGIALPDVGAPMPEAPISATEIDKLTPEQEKYNWEVRVFQQRQQNIPIACEIPQLMDERAGAIARAIRAEMKS